MRSYLFFLATCGAVAIIPVSTLIMRQATPAFATAGWFHPDSDGTDAIRLDALLSSDPLPCAAMKGTRPELAPCRVAQTIEPALTPKSIIAAGSVVRVGDQIQPNDLHQITRPGLYGLGHPPKGHSYGIIDGKLVRYNLQTKQVLSVIRTVDEIYD